MGPIFKFYYEVVKILHDELPNAFIMPFDLRAPNEYARTLVMLPDGKEFVFIISHRQYPSGCFELEIHNAEGFMAAYTPLKLEAIRYHVKQLAKPQLPAVKYTSFYPHMSRLLLFLSTVINPSSMELCAFDGDTYARYFAKTSEPTIKSVHSLSDFSFAGLIIMFDLQLECPGTHKEITVPGFFGMCMGIDNCDEPLDGVFYGFGTKESGIWHQWDICTTTFDEDMPGFMEQFRFDYSCVRAKPFRFGYTI